MSETQRPQTEDEFHAKFLADAIGNIATRLHDLADQIARHANAVARVGSGPGRDTYAAIAASVVHDVTWGVANLSLERPCQNAAAADAARAVAKTVLP